MSFTNEDLKSAPKDVKVVLLGDTGVGKSSLVLRFLSDTFKPFSASTIGASYMSKIIEVQDRTIKFQIWDTAGQEKYKSLAPMYYRGSAAAILVYDITQRESLRTLKMWVAEVRRIANNKEQQTLPNPSPPPPVTRKWAS